jgi:hypothetical protein
LGCGSCTGRFCINLLNQPDMKKMNAPFHFMLLTVASITLHSCFPINLAVDPYIVDIDRQKENSYHAPSMLHAPLLSEKNDFSIAANYAVLTRHNGVDLQAAFVPVEHLGLQAGFRSYSQKGSQASGDIESYEFGAGYVKDWGKLLFEAYGGIGGGNIQNDHHTGSSHLRYTSYYVQPTFAIQSKSKTTQFAVIAKLYPVKFAIVDTTFDGARENFVATQFETLGNKPNQLFLEPGFVFRSGWKNVRIQTGLSFAVNLSGEDFLRDKTNFSIGCLFRFNSRNTKHDRK